MSTLSIVLLVLLVLFSLGGANYINWSGRQRRRLRDQLNEAQIILWGVASGDAQSGAAQAKLYRQHKLLVGDRKEVLGFLKILQDDPKVREALTGVYERELALLLDCRDRRPIM